MVMKTSDVTHVMVGVRCQHCEGKTSRPYGRETLPCLACQARGFVERAITLEEFAKLFTWGSPARHALGVALLREEGKESGG